MSFFKKLFGKSEKEEGAANTSKIDIDALITSDDLNKSIIELDTYIGELCAWGSNLDALTLPQKNFYFNQELEREVNNGGFDLYFLNSSGGFAHQTITSLKAIGANLTAGILQEAVNKFPGKKVPVDKAERQQVVMELDKSDPLIWDALDQQFFNYDDNLNQLNMDYVQSHKRDFE